MTTKPLHLIPKRPGMAELPCEGLDGRYSQTWYPVCLSSELAVGQLIGREFLGGRVVAFRGDDGVAQVVSAYCPHLGADLETGCVVGQQLRCAFHHWYFGRDGQCVKTGSGDLPPPRATLKAYPTTERHGLVWAFNGDTPLFDIPDFGQPDEGLLVKAMPFSPSVINVDPWVIYSNPLDFQHLRALHGFRFEDDPVDKIHVTDLSISCQLEAIVGEHKMFADIAIYGTNIFRKIGTFNGHWAAIFIATAMPAPRCSSVYFCVAVQRSQDDPAAAQALLDQYTEFHWRVFSEDLPILQSIHFRPGALTRSDRGLVEYFNYIRRYPRADPGAEFLR